jgi:2-succinyl-5-enolpyruvyl-6-hydroxy-3-cyclohexene-1-carboxylate synthase
LTEQAQSDSGGAAWRRSVALFDGLAGAGLRHIVLSPGSRSTALALAAARCEAFTLHVIADERSAAFFALGLARATGGPAALVATSGSAPAHWLPAAIEACEDEQPLLLLSADRPLELLDCGANQATEQGRLFAAHARAVFALPADAGDRHAWDVGRRAAAACRWPRPGPVHINVALREPLVPADPEACTAWSPGPAAVEAPAKATPSLPALAGWAARLRGRTGAILVGRLPPSDPAAEAAIELAQALDCPLIADPLSGLRHAGHPGARVICTADAFLRHPAAPVPDWLIRVGRPPVSRWVEEWAARCGDTLLLGQNAAWADPSRAAARVVLGDPAASLAALAAVARRAELQAAPWDALDRLDAAAREALAGIEAPPAEAALVRAAAAAAGSRTPLFVSNSLVVRDFDSFLGRDGEALVLHANRGVSGIDGNLSTAAGIAAGSGRTTLAVLGDLALFHDLNALALLREVPVVAVVINNGGGAIFGQLSQAALPEFERLWLTPPGLSAERAAALFDLPYDRLDIAADPAAMLRDALAAGRGMLLEYVVDRAASHAGRKAWWDALAGSVTA